MARLLRGGEFQMTDTPFVQDMVDACKSHGECVYLKDPRTKEEVTFRQFLERAVSVSSALRELKQGPGKIVPVFSDTSIEALTALFGIWISGAASACLNPRLPAEEILFMLKTCRSEVFYCEEESLGRVREAATGLDWPVTIISPNGVGDGVIDFFSCSRRGGSLEGLEKSWGGKDHPVAVMFTSGTTGSPKGVVIRAESLKFTAHVKNLWADRSRILLTTPMYWVSNTLSTVIAAKTCSEILIASRMSTEQILDTITVYKPTNWFSGPALLIDISQRDDLDQYDFSSFETIYFCGYILLPEQRLNINRKLFDGRGVLKCLYGSTEACIVSFDQHSLDLDSPKIASLGQVCKGVTVKVVDPETGKIQPPYALGEVCVRSPGVMKEYFNKTVTEAELDKEGFWHMSDLAYYDEDGYLYYSSRLKDVMKYRGQQIAPAELESILQRHPDVVESCVVAKTCLEQGGDLPAAFVVKKAGSQLTEEELHCFMSKNVIEEKKLRGGIYFLDSLPKSSVGKVLRLELQKQFV